MRVDKNKSDNLIVINSVNSVLFKKITMASDFITKLNEQGFNNIAVIVDDKINLEVYSTYLPKEVLYVINRNDVELAKDIFKDSILISNKIFDKLVPYIIAVDEAKDFFEIKNSAKILLIDSDIENRQFLVELSKESFCAIAIRFGKQFRRFNEDGIALVVQNIKNGFKEKGNRFIKYRVSENLNDSGNKNFYFQKILPTFNINNIHIGNQTVPTSVTISSNPDSYIQSHTEPPEPQEELSSYVEKYRIILVNIARGVIAHNNLLSLPNKEETEPLIKNFIDLLYNLVQSLTPEIGEEKKRLDAYLEANPQGFSEAAILKFYNVMNAIILATACLSKVYVHHYAEEFIKNLSIALKDFEKFSTIPSAEILVEQINSENPASQLEMQQNSHENTIVSKNNEKGKEKEDLGTDTEDELDAREIAGVSKRKWVDEVDKRSNAAEKPAKKYKSYVEEEIKPSGAFTHRESSKKGQLNKEGITRF